MNRRRGLRHAVEFLFYLVPVGFTLETVSLMLPARWITSGVRQLGWNQSTENAAVVGIFIIAAFLSCVICSLLARWTVGLRALGVMAVSLAPWVVAGTALWFWLHPQLLGSALAPETKSGQRFTFGPYPSEERMRELKAEGYTVVVSLLHPAVAPFESKLIADERLAAGRVGLAFLHVPMLPWISDNAEALARLRGIAREGTGRYYVHCYLGRDRVELVRRLVQRWAPQESRSAVNDGASLRLPYERGSAYELEQGVFLLPFPTDHEFMRVVQAAGTVVSLLDPDNVEDRPWIERERSLLEQYGTAFELMPIAAARYDPYRVLEVARAVRQLPRPVVIHAFLSASTDQAPVSRAFMQAYLSDLPPLHPMVLNRSAVTGWQPVAPHVMVGPEPKAGALARLKQLGVRGVAYAGPGSSAGAVGRLVKSVGLEWAERLPGEMLNLVAHGGPWYICGPRVFDAAPLVAGKYGPAMRQPGLGQVQHTSSQFSVVSLQ